MSADSQLMTYLVRMVVPMRREFGVALDVHQFVHDSVYATQIINRARASVDPRLRECADSIERRLLLGPRAANAPAAVAAAAAAGTLAPPTQPAPATAPAPLAGTASQPAPARTAPASEAELRARMMKKYTTGLR